MFRNGIVIAHSLVKGLVKDIKRQNSDASNTKPDSIAIRVWYFMVNSEPKYFSRVKMSVFMFIYKRMEFLLSNQS